MKKILLIALVVVSALGVAATIKEVNTKEEATKLPAETVESAPRSAIVSNWD